MSRLSLFAALLLLPGAAGAADTPVPGPGLPPERVVEIQLDALQRNDEPHADAGIELAWSFAHPANKAATGPLERFAAMIKNPVYRPLLNHLAHEIKRVAITGDAAVVAATVTPASGPVVFYQWRLERVASGPHAGAWMTAAVSSPAERGDSI